MEDVKTITISCQGSTTVNLDELIELQGTLKDLTETGYEKLKKSILTYGFAFPAFIWIDPQGQKFIMDAHQRYRTLSKMRDEEGYTIPALPAVEIFAESRKQAKEKLLLLNSRYGKITREGYDDFIDEEGFEVSETDMHDMLEIPEVEIWDNPTTTTPDDTSGETTNPSKIREIECPHCHGKFNLFDTNKDQV